MDSNRLLFCTSGEHIPVELQKETHNFLDDDIPLVNYIPRLLYREAFFKKSKTFNCPFLEFLALCINLQATTGRYIENMHYASILPQQYPFYLGKEGHL